MRAKLRTTGSRLPSGCRSLLWPFIRGEERRFNEEAPFSLYAAEPRTRGIKWPDATDDTIREVLGPNGGD
jgi:hypothetical protein